METWRDIPGLQGYYQASIHGQIRSIDRHQIDIRGRRMFRRGRVLKQILRKGHPGALLSVDGATQTQSTCRLIALTFLGQPPACFQAPRVIHIDEDAANNHISNLRWGSCSEVRVKGRKNQKRLRRKA